MKFILVFLSFVSATISWADEGSYYIKKLVDGKTETTMFLACNYQDNCRVLANGSFKNSDLLKLKEKMKLTHRLENAALIGGSTISIAIQPYVIFSMLSVPAGIVTFIGSSAYVYFRHETFDSYKKIDFVSPDSRNRYTSIELIQLINEELIDLREEIGQ
jgi:hypothetical protein